MKKLIHWAARLYPQPWRRRYDHEFDALLDDIAPSWLDLCDIVGRALSMRCRALVQDRLLIWSGACPVTTARQLHLSILFTSITHAMVLSFVIVASWAYVSPMPLRGPAPPSPPPAPPPPTELADPRVFFDKDVAYAWVYSSLPPQLSGTRIVEGVGMYFPALPDMGATDRSRNSMRRVWPGQALDANITRRVIPKYPAGAPGRGVVSVFLEYLVGTDGSVKVLRTLGPTLFANAARSAIEGWVYRPVRMENCIVEVVSRVEVRFDGELANPRNHPASGAQTFK